MAESDNTFHPSVDNTAPFKPFDFADEGKLVPKYTPKYDTYTTDHTILFPNPSPNPLLGVVAPPAVAEDEHDAVNHPKHYNDHASGIECIEITEHYMTCLGNPIKYLFRLGQKDATAQELGKAQWYIKREIDWLRKYSLQRRYANSIVMNRDIVLGLIERYLAHEPEGTLRDVKELVMLAPFNTPSTDSLHTAVELLDQLIEEAGK